MEDQDLEVSQSNSSPQLQARLAGGFFLATILLGIIGQVLLSSRILAGGDAAATADNILAQQGVLRLVFALFLIELASQITMTTLFYYLLKPVNESVSLLAAVFSFTGCGIKIVSRLFLIAPVLILAGSGNLSSFSTQQLQELSLFSIGLVYLTETIAVIFFGLSAVLKGYLFYRSTFLPWALGVLNALGGLGWMTYLYEPVAARLAPVVIGVALIGALATIVWLLIFGVDEQKWKERAAIA